jgi:hypothetical protein
MLRTVLTTLAVLAGCSSSAEAPPEGGCGPESCRDPEGYESGEECDDGESCLCDRCPGYCDALCPFSLPNADVMANAGDDEDEDPVLQAADFSCLGDNALPAAPAMDVTVTGFVRDFEDDFLIPGATVEVYALATELDAPLASTVSVADGSYSIVVPASALDVARVSWRVVAEDALDTLHLNQAIACATAPCGMDEERLSVSQVTSDSLASILGTSRPDGTSVVIGDVLDCRRRSVAHANGRLLDPSGAEVEGLETYYFEAEFPVRRKLQPWSSADGLVGMINVAPAAEVEIRAYGRIDGEETLLSAAAVPAIADAVVISDLDALGPK